MAVTYSDAVKTARMNAVVAAIDAGTGPGVIEIGSEGMAADPGGVLATITLNDPCGTVTGSVLTLAGAPLSDTSADRTGIAAEARIRDSDGSDVVTGLTVATSGADINLDNTSITTGQTVTITSATITHGA